MNSTKMVALFVVVLGLAMVGPALAQHGGHGGGHGGWGGGHGGYRHGSSFSFGWGSGYYGGYGPGWGYAPAYRTVIVERPVERVVYAQPTYNYYPSSYTTSDQPYYYAPAAYYRPTTYCASTYYSTPTRYYEPATRYYESRGKVRLRNGLLMGAAANEIFNKGHSRQDIRGGAIAATLLNEIFRR